MPGITQFHTYFLGFLPGATSHTASSSRTPVDRRGLSTRTQIYLTDQQRRALDEKAVREGRSLADLIREAVDAYLAVGIDRSEALAATFAAVPDLDVPDRDEWDRG